MLSKDLLFTKKSDKFIWLLNTINSDKQKIPIQTDEQGDYVIIPSELSFTQKELIHRKNVGFVLVQGMYENDTLTMARCGPIEYDGQYNSGDKIYIENNILADNRYTSYPIALIATYIILYPLIYYFKKSSDSTDSKYIFDMIGYSKYEVYNGRGTIIDYLDTKISISNNSVDLLAYEDTIKTAVGKYELSVVDGSELVKELIPLYLIDEAETITVYGYDETGSGYERQYSLWLQNAEEYYKTYNLENIESIRLLIDFSIGEQHIRLYELYAIEINGVEYPIRRTALIPAQEDRIAIRIVGEYTVVNNIDNWPSNAD